MFKEKGGAPGICKFSFCLFHSACYLQYILQSPAIVSSELKIVKSNYIKNVIKMIFLKICVSFKHNWRVNTKEAGNQGVQEMALDIRRDMLFFFFCSFFKFFFRMGTHEKIRVRSAIDIISSAQLNNQKFYIYLYSIPIFGIGVVIIVAACPYYWSCLWLHALCRKKLKKFFFFSLLYQFVLKGKVNEIFFKIWYGMSCNLI